MKADLFQNSYYRIIPILREAYSRPDLNWVKDFVDYIYDSKDFDESYVLDRWNIRIKLIASDDYTIIDDAIFYPDLNYTELIFNEEIIDSLIDQNIKRNEVELEIKRYLFHELYHYQQANNSKKGKPSKEERLNRFKAFMNDKLTPEDQKLLIQEVDAHAKDYANILQNNGYNQKEAIIAMEQFTIPIDKFSEIELSEIELYRSHPAEWKRLLMEMWRYFDET